ncbi:MAG: phage tail protein [Sorangiineae bacterium NIC37A_2]|nr:MAG: phage tail protein [Sorangiineae bacterium NIC37A_2]
MARILTARERQQLRAIVEYLKPAHTHFVDLVEPLPPVLPNHWELGLSDLGETTDLH